jgi:hypothetical protein
MSPIAIAMNLVLGLLLLFALGFGMRLERRLKALRDGQATFAGAIADLDRAAQRAERGLAELRAATEEAVDLLGGRIEKARELAAKLETMTSDAARPIARPAARPTRPAADMPLARAEAEAEDLVLRLTEREAAAARPGRLDPRIAARSRANIDDDLFESAPRAAAGGRR